MANVTMPQLGESVTEGTILEWFKQPGDPVVLDDPLCEIETEKVTAELPSPYAGVMGEILVPQGETVEVDVPLCVVEEAAGAPKTVASPPTSTPEPVPAPVVADATASVPDLPTQRTPETSARTSRKRLYSPVVVHLAEKHGLDLTELTGTGIGGRITRKDVQAVIAAGPQTVDPRPAEPHLVTPPEPAPIEPPPHADHAVVQLSPTRKSIAAAMTRSISEAPQAWTMVEVDITALLRIRREQRDQYHETLGFDLTLLPYFTAAVARALGEHPELNARWEGDRLLCYRPLNLGIAIATDNGLIVPVIHDAASLSVAGIAQRINDLAQRARERKLRIEDIEGGTFTVNNTGSFGSISSKPILNFPQVAIVTMERVVKRPVVIDGDAIAVRSMLNVCLSFDHRALDGHEVGAFLATLRRHLETFQQ